MNPIAKKFLAGLLSLLSAGAFAAVDVNKASQAELETIAGVGTAMSTKILDARKQSAFQDWSDLITRVNGVGAGNAAKFSTSGLTVNGTAYTAVMPMAAKPQKAPAAKTTMASPVAPAAAKSVKSAETQPK